jgi:hypothetical protein
MATLNSMLIAKNEDSQNDNILILLVSKELYPSPRYAEGTKSLKCISPNLFGMQTETDILQLRT